jgi:hypothetical protein
MKRIFLLTTCFIAFYEMACCQAVTIPFTPDHWNMENAQTSLETYKGKECILFKSGNIFTKNIDLRDGVIEVDVSLPQQRGFPGIVFRMVDPSNFENFYMRPHQSGNPDATQYTPVFNTYAGWQLYHGEGYSKATSYKFGEWHHIRIDIHGITAEVYIDDMQNPFIKITELKRGWVGGNLGLISGNLPVRFANLQYTVKQLPAPSPAVIPVPATGSNGLITRYQVSSQLNRELFDKKFQLTPDIKSKLKWTTQSTESSGTINLGKFSDAKDTGDVIIARVVIRSEEDQVKPISFGFSDYVMVYLNDKALYFGADTFLSRDYRYLGTIGFFDMLFLPLKKGDNELWFVVTEDFGGWGVKAKLGDMTKISLR